MLVTVMASSSDMSSRANIRIEIKNDFSEEMDVDMVQENALSEGELEDDEIGDLKENEDVLTSQTKNKISFSRNVARVEKQWTHNDGGFTTGVDIFGKDEQEKLHNRAQRFGLDPNECKGMSDQQLLDLHDSLGITAEDESNTRFEAIHMYGTHDMSTQDVFEYFGKYGPASIEWINDESCNVVWLDKVSAARAFHGLSSPITGMPVTGKCDPFKEDKEKQEEEEAEEGESESQGRSILLVSKNREVELYDENEDKPMDEEEDEDKENGVIKKSEATIHVSEIDIPVPPGYWRLGISHPKSKYVLLRFAKRTDRKPFKAERFSQYYKKYGNPNYGGIKGLISQSKKLRMKGVHQAVGPEILDEPETIVSGNPWGSLAKNWNSDVRERMPEISSNVPSQSKPSKSILDRLGSTNKRVHVQSDNDDDDDNNDDEKEESDKEEEIVAKKSKVPRMRMYADEEEARVEKVKQLKKIRQLEKIEEIISQNEFRNTMPDLRNTVPDLRNTRIDIRHAVPELRIIRTDVRNAVSDNRNEMSDLRNRIRKQGTTKSSSLKTFHADKIPDIVSSGRINLTKQEIRRPTTRHSESDNSDDDDVNVQQKSKVTVIVKKPNATVKPTVASTIWARLDKEKEQQKQKLQLAKNSKNESHSESSESSAVASDAESNSDYEEKYDSNVRSKFSKALNHRPGFNRDLKSRLGLSSEHKSPLRIEINNDHYKKS